MARAGQEINGFGLTLRIVELQPELLAMDAAHDGSGGLPPEHLHPSQSERFEVIEGSMRAIVDGDERLYGPGDVFDVPAGACHQMAAEGGPARLRWEVRPALRTAEFFERLYAGDTGDSLADFLAEFSDEVSFTQR